jgi:hypothetical protein
MRSRNLARLEEALKELGRLTPVLVLDEAQHYPPGALEEVRLLLGLNLPRQPVFALVLIGDLYLQETLRLQHDKALYSRIGARGQLPPLDRNQVEPYLLHTLRQVGIERACLHPAAVDLLASASHGLPRLLNLLARAAWIAAAQTGANTIGPEHVQEALDQVPAARDKAIPFGGDNQGSGAGEKLHSPSVDRATSLAAAGASQNAIVPQAGLRLLWETTSGPRPIKTRSPPNVNLILFTILFTTADL